MKNHQFHFFAEQLICISIYFINWHFKIKFGINCAFLQFIYLIKDYKKKYIISHFQLII